MRDLSMMCAGLSAACALINGMNGNYLMMFVMIALAMFNVEMGTRNVKK